MLYCRQIGRDMLGLLRSSVAVMSRLACSAFDSFGVFNGCRGYWSALPVPLGGGYRR